MREDNNAGERCGRVRMPEHHVRSKQLCLGVGVFVFVFVGHDEIDCLIVPWQRCTGIIKMAMSW